MIEGGQADGNSYNRVDGAHRRRRAGSRSRRLPRPPRCRGRLRDHRERRSTTIAVVERRGDRERCDWRAWVSPPGKMVSSATGGAVGAGPGHLARNCSTATGSRSTGASSTGGLRRGGTSSPACPTRSRGSRTRTRPSRSRRRSTPAPAEGRTARTAVAAAPAVIQPGPAAGFTASPQPRGRAAAASIQRTSRTIRTGIRSRGIGASVTARRSRAAGARRTGTSTPGSTR